MVIWNLMLGKVSCKSAMVSSYSLGVETIVQQ